MADIHNLCAACRKDFYTMDDWDAHRVPSGRTNEARKRCLDDKELKKLKPPMKLVEGVWSTSDGHAKRIENIERAAKARAGRGKKLKVAAS